jgi:hypothetical protein
MEYLRLLTVAMVAVFALSAIIATAAQAANPKIEGSPVEFTGSGSSSKLTAGSHEITCTANTTKGSVKSSGEEGEDTTKFTSCTTEAGATKCKTEGAAAGEIVLPATVIHFILISPSLFAVLFLVLNFDILCNVLLILVIGPVILHSSFPLSKKVTSTEFVGAAKEGKQEFRTCELPSALCAEGPFELKAEFIEGKEENAVETATDTVTFTKEVEAVE